MEYTVYGYAKCSTCKNALKWLEERKISFRVIDLKETPPPKEEMEQIIQSSELPLKRFFNTSGLSYRALGLKDKLPQLSFSEAVRLLAEDGMLVKRPMIVKNHQFVVNGFKEKEYEELFS